MKRRLCLLTLFAGFAIALPAWAQILYNGGPINGETDAWTINEGFVVSDTFTLFSGSNATVNGISFGAWLFPGDTLESVDVSFTHFEFGGTIYFNQTVNFTASGCFVNTYGFDVCQETGFFSGVNLAGGTYWMNLQNAVVNTGDPVYWDENDGVGCTSPGCPSMGDGNNCIADGTFCVGSESFTLSGNNVATVPEPSSMVLFGSGLLSVVAMVRRKRRL